MCVHTYTRTHAAIHSHYVWIRAATNYLLLFVCAFVSSPLDLDPKLNLIVHTDTAEFACVHSRTYKSIVILYRISLNIHSHVSMIFMLCELRIKQLQRDEEEDEHFTIIRMSPSSRLSSMSLLFARASSNPIAAAVTTSPIYIGNE